MLSILLFTFLAAAQATEITVPKENPWKLRPFTTDSCTIMADGTKENPKKWEHCCLAHDLAYWAGGTFTERQNADLEFKQCLASTGEKTLAFFAYLGVRVSGTAILPTPYRWGYGWTGIRGYWPLTQNEKAAVQSFTPSKRFAASSPQ